MSESEETPKPRKGPKPNPISAYEKARAKAEKARAAYAKVERLAEAVKEAEAEERAAYDALQEALKSVPVPVADDAE